jgi:hypothetical protein
LGCMPVKYRSSPGRAIGALRSESKPPGLDVGVFAYSFLWFFLRGFTWSKSLLRLSRLISRLVEAFRFYRGEVVQSVRVHPFVFFFRVGWVEWMIRCFRGSVSCSLSSLGFFAGGSW